MNDHNDVIELEVLLREIYLKYGYDFRDYSTASILRRVLRRKSFSGFKTISEMQHRVLNDTAFFEKLLLDISVNVTEMFRDPTFYRALREKIIPHLRSKEFIKIWHAGCATGEEVYSMAIVLKEENLYNKARIYATDFNEDVLRKAKEGIYPVERLKEYTRSYIKSGGQESFSDYYTARYEFVILDQSLKKNVIFSDHNLVTDDIFGEMDMIVCRNVLIYFNKNLQNRVLKHFRDSLCDGGYLCLGSKESIRISECSDYFDGAVEEENIYKKNVTHG